MIRAAHMGQAMANILAAATLRIGAAPLAGPPPRRGGRLRTWAGASTSTPSEDSRPRGLAAPAQCNTWRQGASRDDLSLPPEPWQHLQLDPRHLGERVVVVGDVHGCSAELEDLLQSVQFRPSRGPRAEKSRGSAGGGCDVDYAAWPDVAEELPGWDTPKGPVGDTLVLVGDLVNKGPDPTGVISLAMDLGAYCVAGNHDYSLLRHLRSDGISSRGSVFRYADWAGGLSPSEVEWLDRLPITLMISSLDMLVVHAGVVPGVSLREQRTVDLIKMRSLIRDRGGRWLASELAAAGDASAQPWANVWSEDGTARLGKSGNSPRPHIYYGHDAARGIQLLGHATGLDGGVCYGGHLVAAVLPARGPRVGRDRRICGKKARRQYAPTSLPNGAYELSEYGLHVHSDTSAVVHDSSVDDDAVWLNVGWVTSAN